MNGARGTTTTTRTFFEVAEIPSRMAESRPRRSEQSIPRIFAPYKRPAEGRVSHRKHRVFDRRDGKWFPRAGFAEVSNLGRRDATHDNAVALDRTRLMWETKRRGSANRFSARVRRNKAIPGGELCRLQVGIHLHWLARTYVSSSAPRRATAMHTAYANWLLLL